MNASSPPALPFFRRRRPPLASRGRLPLFSLLSLINSLLILPAVLLPTGCYAELLSDIVQRSLTDPAALVGKEGKLPFDETEPDRVSGTIPAALGDLGDSLTVLKLREHLKISGTIPPELARLTKLTTLDIRLTSVSGTLPSAIGHLTDLEELRLSFSFISGTLPTSIESMAKLRQLRLTVTNMTGTIHPGFGDHLKQLTFFQLSMTRLSGTIPANFSGLARPSSSRSFKPAVYMDREFSAVVPVSCDDPNLAALCPVTERPLFQGALAGILLAVLVASIVSFALLYRCAPHDKGRERKGLAPYVVRVPQLGYRKEFSKDFRLNPALDTATKIADGRFGPVEVVKLDASDDAAAADATHEVVVKWMRRYEVNAVQQVAAIHECDVLFDLWANHLGHQFCVQVHGFTDASSAGFGPGALWQPRDFGMVLEYLPDGDLHHYLRSAAKAGRPVTAMQKILWALQIGAALDHLHTVGFVHRDVAARNVLLIPLDIMDSDGGPNSGVGAGLSGDSNAAATTGGGGTVASADAVGGGDGGAAASLLPPTVLFSCKLADFGLAERMDDEGALGESALTAAAADSSTPLPLRWSAPESFGPRALGRRSLAPRLDEADKLDVWSFGVLLWEMETMCATPYEGRTDQQVREWLSVLSQPQSPNGRGPIELGDPPVDCSSVPAFRAVISKCHQRVPGNRPTMHKIANSILSPGPHKLQDPDQDPVVNRFRTWQPQDLKRWLGKFAPDWDEDLFEDAAPSVDDFLDNCAKDNHGRYFYSLADFSDVVGDYLEKSCLTLAERKEAIATLYYESRAMYFVGRSKDMKDAAALIRVPEGSTIMPQQQHHHAPAASHKRAANSHRLARHTSTPGHKSASAALPKSHAAGGAHPLSSVESVAIPPLTSQLTAIQENKAADPSSLLSKSSVGSMHGSSTPGSGKQIGRVEDAPHSSSSSSTESTTESSPSSSPMRVHSRQKRSEKDLGSAHRSKMLLRKLSPLDLSARSLSRVASLPMPSTTPRISSLPSRYDMKVASQQKKQQKAGSSSSTNNNGHRSFLARNVMQRHAQRTRRSSSPHAQASHGNHGGELVGSGKRGSSLGPGGSEGPHLGRRLLAALFLVIFGIATMLAVAVLFICWAAIGSSVPIFESTIWLPVSLYSVGILGLAFFEIGLLWAIWTNIVFRTKASMPLCSRNIVKMSAAYVVSWLPMVFPLMYLSHATSIMFRIPLLPSPAMDHLSRADVVELQKTWYAVHQSEFQGFLVAVAVPFVLLKIWVLLVAFREAFHNLHEATMVQIELNAASIDAKLPRNYQRQPKHITRGKELGSGQYGKVYEGVWQELIGLTRSSKTVAIKTIKSTLVNHRDHERFVEECKRWMMLGQGDTRPGPDASGARYLVKCYGWAVAKGKEPHRRESKRLRERAGAARAATRTSMQTHSTMGGMRVKSSKQEFWILSELMTGGSLEDFLQGRKKDEDPIPVAWRIHWAKQIAQGLEYMHNKCKMVHRDVAARNVLVTLVPNNLDDPPDVKLADFGLTRELEGPGVPCYIAPVDENGLPDEKVGILNTPPEFWPREDDPTSPSRAQLQEYSMLRRGSLSSPTGRKTSPPPAGFSSAVAAGTAPAPSPQLFRTEEFYAAAEPEEETKANHAAAVEAKAPPPRSAKRPSLGQHKYKATHKSDVFAYAVLLYEIESCGGSPEEDKSLSPIEFSAKLRRGELCLTAPGGSNELLGDLIDKCGQRNPVYRPSMKDVISQLNQGPGGIGSFGPAGGRTASGSSTRSSRSFFAGFFRRKKSSSAKSSSARSATKSSATMPSPAPSGGPRSSVRSLREEPLVSFAEERKSDGNDGKEGGESKETRGERAEQAAQLAGGVEVTDPSAETDAVIVQVASEKEEEQL